MKHRPRIKYGFPMVWPEGKKRTVAKKHGPYTTSWKEAEVLLEKLAADAKLENPTITSNMIDFKLQGDDTAVMVSFGSGLKTYALYCDQFYRASHNLIYLVRYLEHWVKMDKMKVVVLEELN